MEELLNLVIFIICGAAGVGVMTLFRNKSTRQENNKVIEKVKDIESKNAEMAKQVIDNLTKAAQRVEELEKQKNDKPKTDQELADWFNNRKPD
jgi:ribosome-binding ATPase YchF (GTP1/OBG family)